MVHYPKLSLIVARSLNNVIGVDGGLPWKISSDLKYFKRATMGKPVMMGRITWESLPFPLPGRPNLVLSRNVSYKADKAEVFSDVNEMVGRGFELAGELNVDEVMVIGGAGLYTALLPYCERMHITEVQTRIEGDAFFPEFDSRQWEKVYSIAPDRHEKDDFEIIINVLENKQ